MQACLWAFLAMPLWWAGVALIGCAALGRALLRARWSGQVSLSTLAICAAVAFCLLLLGGEGRITYANTDWQVRDALLRDLGRFAWPFAYDQPGGPLILRAPLGMYLLPALIGKWAGSYAAEIALLIQNSVLLTLVLVMGSGVFASRHEKMIALGVFTGFSCMNLVGQLLVHRSVLLHLDGWAGMQYSAHVTQAFWVPQHALAGWIFAALYLLWLGQRAPAVALWAVMPLLALLSPLALIGCLPFAVHAFASTVAKRELTWGAVLWPVLAGVICLPSLLYLIAGSGSVGAGGAQFKWDVYITFLALEIGGYCYALWLTRRHLRFGIVPTTITVVMLILLPLGRIGNSADFTMRAGIPALALLSLMIAAILSSDEPGQDRATLRRARRLILIVFAIGLATPIGEICRALAWPASPGVQCSYMGVVPGGAPTYVTQLTSLPVVIRPRAVTIVRTADPPRCYNGPWPDAIKGDAS